MSKAGGIPFETTLYVRDHCLCLAAQRAARGLARHFDAALRTWRRVHGEISAKFDAETGAALRAGLGALA